MIVLVFVWLALPTASAQVAEAWEILGLLNTARDGNGIPPLAMNSRLVAAAQRHSDDMAAGDFLSHTGSDGSEFWTRMTEAGYNLDAGAENVLYRWDASASGVFQQWRDSPAHFANMMDPDYLEVGIAYAVAESGKYYFTMVLGARPDFETTPSDDLTDVLVLATPAPELPSADTPIPLTDTVVPVTENSIPLLDTVAPQTQTTEKPVNTPFPHPDTPIPITRSPEPPASPVAAPVVAPSASLTVPAVDAPSNDLASGDLPPTNVAEPTDILRLTTPGGTTAPVYEILDTSNDPVQPRRSLREIARQLQGQRDSGIVLVSPTAPHEVIGVPSSPVPTRISLEPTMTSTEVMVAGLRLEYTDESFSLINTAGRPLYIEGLWFESRSGVLEIDRWVTEYLSAPLDDFPDRGCLQAWGFRVDAVLSPPENCQIRHGWIVVSDDQRFWRGAEVFTVHRYDEAVTVCIVALGSCDVSLSDRLPVYPTYNPPTVAAVDTGAAPSDVSSGATADVRLIYSPDSFTLLNISGVVLDLTGLGFSSSSGTLNISRWNTEYLSRPLYAFPAGDCLQAWPLTLSEWPEKLSQCNLRHAWIAVNDVNVFWAGTDYFTVSRNGAVLETCSVVAGQCEISFR